MMLGRLLDAAGDFAGRMALVRGLFSPHLAPEPLPGAASRFRALQRRFPQMNVGALLFVRAARPRGA